MEETALGSYRGHLKRHSLLLALTVVSTPVFVINMCPLQIQLSLFSADLYRQVFGLLLAIIILHMDVRDHPRPLAFREMVHIGGMKLWSVLSSQALGQNFQSLVLCSILLTHVDTIKCWKKVSM